MTFGVLYVRSRDGRSIEHQLSQASIVVGRAEDSGIPIRDASVARRHARIIVEGDQAFVQDMGSAGGTFVNGERIAANERVAISASDTLHFGDIEAMFEGGAAPATAPTPMPVVADVPDEPELVAAPEPEPEVSQPALSVSQPAPVSEPPPLPPPPAPVPLSNIPLPVADPLPAPISSPASSAPRMSIALTMANAKVEAGGVLTAQVSVQNRGTTVEQVALSVSGLPAEWVTLAPANANLLPGARAEATLTIRPPKAPSTLAGERAFAIVGATRVPGAEVSAHGTMTVLPYDAATYELAPRQSSGDFRVSITNAGNHPVRLQFAGEDAEAVLEYEFTPPHLEVPPGESRTAAVEVRKPGRPLTGVRTMIPFALQLVPDGGEKTDLPGTLTVDPRFGKGLPLKRIAALFLVGLIALLGVFYLVSGDDDVPVDPGTPEPSPTAGPSPEVETPGPAVLDFLCGPDALPAPDSPSEGDIRPASIFESIRRITGADPSSPLFAQNDTRWGATEYAKAKDEEFRSQNTCGSTIEQCGCAMTSVATVMALFKLVTMPDGTALSPEAVNEWFNIGAQRTNSGWVSQGYIYGNVIWSAANQLSGAIKQADPDATTVRFRTTGDGSDAQVRSELAAGRPVVLEVPGHWIAAVGIDPATNKIIINDPYYADRTTLDVYEGKVLSSVLFESADDLSAVVVSVPAKNRVRVTDDQGRVTGTLDAGPAQETAAKAEKGIPGSNYTFTSAWRDPTCTEKPPPPGAGTIQITLPSGSGYKIEVTSPTKEDTSVAIHLYDADGNLVLKTQDAPGDNVITMTPTETPTPVPTTAVPTTAVPTTAVPTTAVPTTAVPTTAVPTTAVPTTAVPDIVVPAATMGCSEPAVILVAEFPAEAEINCQLKIDGEYDSITWYYNHGRCDPPRGGGVCEGRSLTQLEQWQDSTAIRGFGAVTKEPETFTFIANVCQRDACRATYYWVEFQQRTSRID